MINAFRIDSVYDRFVAKISRKYGNGLKMQYAYHPQNRRLTDITTLSGNSQLSHTAYTYDAAGNITQAVSSYPWLAGQTFTETFAYDSTNQLVSAANPQTYALSVTNGDWSRAYEYDWLGRRTSYNEDNLATYYTYDGLNPATETHKWQENGQPKQKKITCRYIANRLDSVIYSDSTLPTVYSYDYAGRVASVLDESGRMDYAYGSMGEVKSETRTYALPFLATDLALTTQYKYDSWGRTQSVTYPDGETVSYDYDRGGQLFKMSNYLDSVLYDKFGAVTSRKYGNGLKMQYAYHPQNRRLTAITTFSGNSQLSHTAYTYDLVGNVTQAVSSYPWLAGQTFTETFSYDSTNQLVSAANPQTYALSVTYGDWGKIQEYGLQQTDLASNTTTSQTRTYSYGSLNEGQTAFAPNSISYADGTNVNEQYGINGSLSRRETATPGNAPSEELYRFGAYGNLRMYSYDRLFFALYGYDGGTTRTYKYSFDLNPNWVNGRLENVSFNPHTAMFYPNSYLNFNQDGHYTKHYYNGMERIASRLGDQNLQIHTHDPELQDRKDWQDSLIRKNVTEITGYEFLPVGEEQTLEDPKPVFELPQVGITGLQPIGSGDVYYYHPNHLGSTCYVTDGNASVQQGFLYAPFGEITNEHNSSFGNGVIPKYSFNAKELDEETGMYYYEARYYQPPVFTSRDRLFEKYPFMTPYGYCANNPVKYIDPTGMEMGEYYSPRGKYLNSDGENDNKIYIVPFRSDQKKVKKGNFDVEKYELPSIGIRKEMCDKLETLNSEDNLREYGGAIWIDLFTREQFLRYAKPGPQWLGGTHNASIDVKEWDDYDFDATNKTILLFFHSHFDGKIDGQGIKQEPSNFLNGDERGDVQNVLNNKGQRACGALFPYNMVFAMRDREVHFYTEKGTIFSMDFDLFKTLGKK